MKVKLYGTPGARLRSVQEALTNAGHQIAPRQPRRHQFNGGEACDAVVLEDCAPNANEIRASHVSRGIPVLTVGATVQSDVPPAAASKAQEVDKLAQALSVALSLSQPTTGTTEVPVESQSDAPTETHEIDE